MPFKKKRKKPELYVRSILITAEIDNALTEEAANRSWGKSKLVRSILVDWLNYWRAGKRKTRLPKIDRELPVPAEEPAPEQGQQ